MLKIPLHSFTNTGLKGVSGMALFIQPVLNASRDAKRAEEIAEAHEESVLSSQLNPTRP